MPPGPAPDQPNVPHPDPGVPTGGKYGTPVRKPWGMFGLGAVLGVLFNLFGFCCTCCVPMQTSRRKFYVFGVLVGIVVNVVIWAIVGITAGPGIRRRIGGSVPWPL